MEDEKQLTPEEIRRNAVPEAIEVFQMAKDAQVNSILAAINTAVGQGLYEVRYENDLSEENQQLLIDKGYQITKKQTNSGLEWDISWKK